MSDRLTARQREALALMAEGHGYREIAARMGITHHGVSSLLKAAYARLGVDGHIEAFRVLGWLGPVETSPVGRASATA